MVGRVLQRGSLRTFVFLTDFRTSLIRFESDVASFLWKFLKFAQFTFLSVQLKGKRRVRFRGSLELRRILHQTRRNKLEHACFGRHHRWSIYCSIPSTKFWLCHPRWAKDAEITPRGCGGSSAGRRWIGDRTRPRPPHPSPLELLVPPPPNRTSAQGTSETL
jgi:hypothetical protein